MHRCRGVLPSIFAALAVSLAVATEPPGVPGSAHANHVGGCAQTLTTEHPSLHDAWWDREQLAIAGWEQTSSAIAPSDEAVAVTLSKSVAACTDRPRPRASSITPSARSAAELRIDSLRAAIAADGTRSVSVRWTATGHSPSPRPVTIRIGSSPAGPWHIAAAGLRRTGEIAIPLDRRWNQAVVVRIEFQDANSVQVATRAVELATRS